MKKQSAKKGMAAGARPAKPARPAAKTVAKPAAKPAAPRKAVPAPSKAPSGLKAAARPPPRKATAPAKAPAPSTAPLKAVSAPVVRRPVGPRDYDKAEVERAAKAILKALRPLTGDEEDSDAEAVRNRMSLENAHPRRRADGHYEVFLKYSAGNSVADPEAEAESRARAWFDAHSEYPGIKVAVDVTVLEEREG
ncbi:MAG: hypothetical protein HY904_11135 [Deltaproteobacteria bacterium]|nr:hypothetical protein [Deltaproteobacteria bacterium]